MSDSTEGQLVAQTQEIHEKYIIVRFDFPITQGAPQT